MLSVLFVTEVCCTIKENNKKKNHFSEARYRFADLNYYFASEN